VIDNVQHQFVVRKQNREEKYNFVQRKLKLRE